MEALDLLRHTPDQFLGKRVTINERDYRIGALFRDNDQGYSHFLFNEVSDLCLHIIQVRKEYLSSPEIAKQASLIKSRTSGAIRTKLRQEENPVETPLITVIEANGGNFELHEISWGGFDYKEEPLGSAVISQVIGLLAVKDYVTAINELNNLLSDFPNHTVALTNLASSYNSLNDMPAALEVISKATAIEPNYMMYQANLMIITTDSQHHRDALSYFRQLKANYPQADDYDYYGIHLYLRCGATDEANELLKAATLPKHQADELSEVVSNALVAQKQY